MKNYVCAAAITICLASALSTVRAQGALPPGWPARLELGMADAPGGAAAMRATAPFAFRYQYLAGGVNTGSGWATWNTNGDFARYYIEDSVANGIMPVFSYYQMFQSLPGGGSESDAVYNNLNNAATMTAYCNDLKLFFQKAGAFPESWSCCTSSRTSGDTFRTASVTMPPPSPPRFRKLDCRSSPASPTAYRGLRAPWSSCATPTRRTLPSGITSACGEPGTTSSCPTRRTQPSTHWARAPQPSSRLWAAHSTSPLPSSAIATPAFHQIINGDGGQRWMDAADFRRLARFLGRFSATTGKSIVMWQIPLGNTKMRAVNNSWGHYQDNRPEWFLDDASRAQPVGLSRRGHRGVPLWRRRRRHDLRLQRRQ